MSNPDLPSQHVIEVSNEGFLFDLRPGQHHHPITTGGELDQYLQSTLLKAFLASGKEKLLLFVHGGLNDRKQGMAHFWDSYAEVMRGDYYPVFVVWPSGWASTYTEHLLWVRQGIKAETAAEKTFGILTSPLALLADIGRAVTRLPLVAANNSQSDLETVTPIRSDNGGAAVRQYQQLAQEGYELSIGDDYSLRSDRFLRDITYWPTLPIKYTLASFIDGFGQGAWDNMLRRTQEVYPETFEAARAEASRRLGLVERSGGATGQPARTVRSLSLRQERRAQRYAAAGLPAFVAALRKQQAENPSFEVTLVGHSMGTIILNRVVQDADMDFANIVYMGAACSIKDFSTSVLPYLKQRPHTKFFNLSLHPVAEAGEWYVSLADLPPRGSLLIWIDNFLSNPVTEQERTLGRWRNLFRSGPSGEPIALQFFDNDVTGQLKQQLYFKGFSVGFGNATDLRSIKYQWNEHPKPKDAKERCDNPLTHGEFGQMPYWQPSFWWP
jgi:pimeloyl-ACP methyl ester carboxylesterase